MLDNVLVSTADFFFFRRVFGANEERADRAGETGSEDETREGRMTHKSYLYTSVTAKVNLRRNKHNTIGMTK